MFLQLKDELRKHFPVFFWRMIQLKGKDMKGKEIRIRKNIEKAASKGWTTLFTTPPRMNHF